MKGWLFLMAYGYGKQLIRIRLLLYDVIPM